jgi:poly(3-hydroxybutyrate) depolymerase
MLKWSMVRFGSPRWLARWTGYCFMGTLLAIVPFQGPRAHARQQDTGFLNRTITVDGALHHYVVYLPMDYTPKRLWPVILFLHGSGERGSDGLDETQVGLPNALRSHYERWPFIVVMPQVPYSHHHWTDPEIMDMAMAALNAEIKEFHGDPQRVYLTGMSLGGYGVWEIAKNYPGKFAAIAPVCGGIYWSYAPQRWHQPELVPQYVKAVGRTPVWLFHGANDPVVSPAQSQIMYSALSTAGGNVRFWEYANQQHNAWDRAYVDPELPQWFLAHRLSDIASSKPYAEKRVIPIHPLPIKVDPTVYDEYQGEYVDAGVTQVTVFRQGNKLMSRNRTGDQTELLPEQPNRFFYPSGSTTRLTFQKGADGKVTGLLFSDDRHQELWERAPEKTP